MTPVPVETLARILNARIVVSAHRLLEGRVYIAIDALHVTLAKMTAKDIAVVGDDEPAQLAFIAAGIACLIIAEGAPVGERVIAAAEKKGVSVLSTPLDAFGVGRMINLSLPAREVMEKERPGPYLHGHDRPCPAGGLRLEIPGSLRCQARTGHLPAS